MRTSKFGECPSESADDSKLWSYFKRISEPGGLACRLCSFQTKVSSSRQPLLHRLQEHMESDHRIFSFCIGPSLINDRRIMVLHQARRTSRKQQRSLHSQRNAPPMSRYNTVLMNSTSNMLKSEHKSGEYAGSSFKNTCKKNWLSYFTQNIDLDQFRDSDPHGSSQLHCDSQTRIVGHGTIFTEPLKYKRCYSAKEVEIIMEQFQRMM